MFQGLCKFGNSAKETLKPHSRRANYLICPGAAGPKGKILHFLIIFEERVTGKQLHITNSLQKVSVKVRFALPIQLSLDERFNSKEDFSFLKNTL